MNILSFVTSTFVVIGIFYQVVSSLQTLNCSNITFYKKLHSQLDTAVKPVLRLSLPSCPSRTMVKLNLRGSVNNE